MLAGCGTGGEDPTRTQSPVGTPTGPTTGAPPTNEPDVTCALQADNALRFDCTVTTQTPGPIELEWAPTDGGTTRSLTRAEATTEHAVTVWGMKPETEYILTVSAADGVSEVALTSGSLPDPLAGPIATTTGTLSIGQVLVELPCGGLPTLAMLDTDGEIVWYQQYPQPDWTGAGIAYQGFQYTPRGTILLSLAMNEIWEHTLAGEEVRHLVAGTDWPGDPVHHDVHMAPNGRVYTLFGYVATPMNAEYIFDGFFVFDDSGLIGEWRMTDHFPITDGWGTGPAVFWQHIWPDVSDYAHANSIAALDDGTVLISLKGQETVFEVDGDPDSPTFGELRWALAGNPASHPYDGDFTITSTGGVTAGLDFYANHHASFFGTNRIGLFDNRSGVGTSRGLVFDLDVTAGTADIVEVYETGMNCPAQGALYPVSNGNRLLTCAAEQTVMEFAPGAATPHWTMDITCGGNSVMVPRAIPVE